MSVTSAEITKVTSLLMYRRITNPINYIHSTENIFCTNLNRINYLLRIASINKAVLVVPATYYLIHIYK